MPQTSTPRPSVLVLMAARNGEPWIVEQLKSIAAQRDVAVEVLISDDGSTDATQRMVSEFKSGLPIRVVSPPAPTGSAAQNFFWLLDQLPPAGYDYIALADQDDLWLEDKLASACQALGTSGAAGYSSAVTAFWPDGSEIELSQVPHTTPGDFLFEGAGQGCTFVLTAAFAREASAFLALHSHLLAPVHYHDWTLYALARSWRKPWFFDSTPRMRYRQHASNDTGARSSLGGVAKRLGLIRSGWYGRQLSAMTEICLAAAPGDSLIADWKRRLGRRRGLPRQLAISGFCMKAGRRRRADTLILVVAALAGWI